MIKNLSTWLLNDPLSSSYSSGNGHGKINKNGQDIELIDMTPQTIVETDKSFENENQENFEERRVR